MDDHIRDHTLTILRRRKRVGQALIALIVYWIAVVVFVLQLNGITPAMGYLVMAGWATVIGAFFFNAVRFSYSRCPRCKKMCFSSFFGIIRMKCSACGYLISLESLENRCCHCGYDLRGTTGGRCPECGNPTELKQD